jgi:hypothetical protein
MFNPLQTFIITYPTFILYVINACLNHSANRCAPYSTELFDYISDKTVHRIKRRLKLPQSEDESFHSSYSSSWLRQVLLRHADAWVCWLYSTVAEPLADAEELKAMDQEPDSPAVPCVEEARRVSRPALPACRGHRLFSVGGSVSVKRNPKTNFAPVPD